MLEDFGEDVERSVWENNAGSNMMTVTGLLETGAYTVERTVRDDGTVVLECEPVKED